MEQNANEKKVQQDNGSSDPVQCNAGSDRTRRITLVKNATEASVVSLKNERITTVVSRNTNEEEERIVLGSPQTGTVRNIKSELQEQPVAVSVSFSYADTSSILWQHRKSSSPTSILPDIVEEDTQDLTHCEESGERFEVVDLTADSEEESRGTEHPQIVLPSAGDQERIVVPPLKLVESGNTKKQSFMCVACKKYYISVSNLQRSKDGTGIEYHCTMCPLVFNMEKSFCKHLKNHSVKYVLFCQQCNDFFGKKDFVCHVCKQEFRNAVLLEAHRKIHADDLLVCFGCGRRFKTEKCLKEHRIVCSTASKFTGNEKRSYQGLPWHKIFRCEKCQEQFLTQKLLMDHKIACSDVRPKRQYFFCNICAEHFLSFEDMAAHKSIHNSPMASYACDSCGLKYLTPGGLASHKNTHSKKYTSCSPSKKPFLGETESNSNESVSPVTQPAKNLQEKQEMAIIEKKMSPSSPVVKSERPQKNNSRQRFLLPKTYVQTRKSPVNTAIQNQPVNKNQNSVTFSALQQHTPKVGVTQYQQLAGSRIVQHQLMPASPVFQSQLVPGNCVPQQLQHVKTNTELPHNQHVLQNPVGQHEQFVNINQQQPQAGSIVSCDNLPSNEAAKHQHLPLGNTIQYQQVPTNSADQYQVSSDVTHSQQQVATNNSFQHHSSANAVHCQEIESDTSGQHQHLLGLNSVQNQQSSMYNNLHSHMSNNSFSNQQNMNTTSYTLSTNAVCNQQQFANNTAQHQQWPVANAHQMAANTNQYHVMSQSSSDQLQQHLTNVSNQQTLITVDGSEDHNSLVAEHQQVSQVIQQQLMCNSVAQQMENNDIQNPQFLPDNATYQLLPTNALQQHMQTNNALESEQSVINSAQNHQLVVAQNQQGANNMIQNQNLSVPNQQLLNNSPTQNHPMIINSSVHQQLISNTDNSQAQNQQLIATSAQNQFLFESNIVQSQQFAENNVIHNQHLFESDAVQKQQSPVNNALQNQQMAENSAQSQQLLENNSAHSLTDVNTVQKDSQLYSQQITGDTTLQNQQLFVHGPVQNQNLAMSQHSMNGIMHSQQPAMCLPFQHQAFPASVVILQPNLPENGAFHQVGVGPNVSQQQLQLNSLQQQQLQQPQQQPQHKLPNSVYGHHLIPAGFMYHVPANGSLTHLPQLQQNIPNSHMLPANMIYQLQPSIASFSGQQHPQGIVSPNQILPINFLPHQLPTNISSQNHFPGVIPQNQQVTGVVSGNQIFPTNVLANYQQVLLANNTAPHQIFLPNALSQHQQFSVAGYPQPRIVLPNYVHQQLAPMKQDSATSTEKDQCCDVCCEEQKSGSGLCHHGKKFKRVSESSGIIVQFVPSYQGMHHTVVNIQAPPDNVTVVKSS